RPGRGRASAALPRNRDPDPRRPARADRPGDPVAAGAYGARDMTSTPFFQVDAFTTGAPLTGNPAAVMPLERWLDDAQMQLIAAENNLSETAFTVPRDDAEADYDLRWFTPTNEVELCGHATIAAGHGVMTSHPVRFSTRSGILIVSRREDALELDHPAARLTETREHDEMHALGLPDPPTGLTD